MTNNALSSNDPIKTDKELWKELKTDIYLADATFLNDEIYGIIIVDPDEGRELICHFELVVNGSIIHKFDPNCTIIPASEFRQIEKQSSVYIKAIPKKQYFQTNTKQSRFYSYVTNSGKFPLTISIRCSWPHSNATNHKPSLVIQWYHIGDHVAHIYALCIDGKEIHYVRKPSYNNAYRIFIPDFIPNEKYIINVIARLTNGREVCRSGDVEYTVPDIESAKKISQTKLSKEKYTSTDIQENRSQYNEFERKSLSTARQNQLSNRLKESQTSSTLQSKERKMQNEISPTCCTNCSSPHEYFPGIDHYFDNTECKCSLPFSQTKPIHAYPNDYDVKTNDITKREHDDDDDVIVN